jgi:hypothetical protein
MSGDRNTRLKEVSPALWSSADVGAWIASIGMQQYRKHFVHNAIDGTLLPEMDLEVLKSELKIATLGHRALILSAIQSLMQHPNGTSTARPSSARLKPGIGT